jgi:hypothetical protein
MAPILALHDVGRRFARRGRVVSARDGASLNVGAGELGALRENVEFPLELRGVPGGERRGRAVAAIESWCVCGSRPQDDRVHHRRPDRGRWPWPIRWS